MRQAAANDVRHLLEDVTDVQRLGHRVEQTAQAVDPLATQLLAIDDGVVLERQAKQVDHAVHQRLVATHRSIGLAGCQPERAVDARALTHVHSNRETRGVAHGVEWRRRITDAMLGTSISPVSRAT